jgi:hypothetical protein
MKQGRVKEWSKDVFDASFEKDIYLIKQRRPNHSPLATCGEWTFKCGE